MGKYKPNDGKLPAAIMELVNQHDGSVSKAENAAGIGHGYFAKLRRGEKPYSPKIQAKIQNALNGNAPLPKGRHTMLTDETSENCPPLLADLIKHVGNKTRTLKIINASNQFLNMVIAGKKPMPKDWIIKAKAELGVPIIGPAPTPDAPPAPQGPPFKAWDGKIGVLKINGKGGGKGRNIKRVPLPIIALCEKFGGITPASAAMGCAATTLMALATSTKKFAEEKWQVKVHNTLHGIVPAGQTVNEDFDRYALGFAIVMMNAAGFDRVADIAEILNGRMVYRRNTKGGWLVIYKMTTVEDLQKFKKLAIRDANDIVCP